MAVAREGNWPKRRNGLRKGAGLAPKAAVGVIVAGEKVVKSSESAYCRFLKKRFSKALAVEMEGAGFMAAAHQFPHVPHIVVRGISDELSNKSKTDRDGWQQVAASNVAAFVFELLDSLPDDDPGHTVSRKRPTPTPPDPITTIGVEFDVRQSEMRKFCSNLGELSEFAAIRFSPQSRPRRGLAGVITARAGVGKTSLALRWMMTQVEQQLEDMPATLTRTINYDAWRSFIQAINSRRRNRKTDNWISNLWLTTERGAMDRFVATVGEQLGLGPLQISFGPSIPSKAPRIAASIITAIEAVLFGLESARSAIRIYPDTRGSFVNIRQITDIASALCSIALGHQSDPRHHFADREGSGASAWHNHLGNISIEPIADAVLVAPDALNREFEILTANLGGIYGESASLHGTPYVRGMDALSGGGCAQACLFIRFIQLET